MTTVSIDLPDDVAQSAQQAGLLTGHTLANVVRELVRQRAARRLLQAMAAFETQPVAADELSPKDVDMAIDAARRH